jgi:tetratricopeptide (TPR) repeat protein
MTPTTPGGLSGVANGMPNMGALPYLPSASVEFVLKGPDGAPIKGGAVITLFKVASSEAMQLSTKGSSLIFSNVPQTEYRVQIVAPLYRVIEKQIDVQNSRSMKVELTLEPLSAEDQALAASTAALPARAQKELGKAIDALRSNNLNNVHSHLDALVRLAPNNAEVNYLYGVYASKTNNDKDAVAYWTHALEVDPRHIRTLLSLGQAYLEEKKTDEALALAKRAAAADPSSWRAEALLAGVAQRQNSPEDLIAHGERALELGHSQAVVVEPMLAAALARRGQKDRAVALLQSYLQDHAGDADVAKELSAIQSGAFGAEAALGSSSAVAEAASEMPLAANWLPPDVDEKMPPAQRTSACSPSDIVANAGQRVQEFVNNLDRFTATESLVHQSIDKWGVAGPPVTSKFDYVAAVQEVRPGLFNFDEYRHSSKGDDRSPDGIATNGLPALVMIFHPYYASTFEMNCEGLSSWEGKPVWQIHFRQKSGETKSLRTYKIGIDGPSYTVELRGRAWIAADSFQIVRLETDLVTPLKQIRLFADHTIVEYAPVAFEKNKLEMWLPRTAEVYFDWRGHRVHRRHSFSKYLLFSVDDKQKISAPKNASPADTSSSSSN